MKCPSCGEESPAKYRFCPICRAPLLDISAQPRADAAAGTKTRNPVQRSAAPIASRSAGHSPNGTVAASPERDHLFETVKETTGSRRNYLKLFGIITAAVVIAGGVIGYTTLGTDIGDEVKAPTDMELAIRDHFLLVEKRTATEIETYYCGDYHWSRVGVETRTDIPNPLLRLNTYTARSTPANNGWAVTATPVTSPEMNVPCR